MRHWGRAPAESHPVREYREAQACLDADPEARSLEEFRRLYQDLLARQQAGGNCRGKRWTGFTGYGIRWRRTL